MFWWYLPCKSRVCSGPNLCRFPPNAAVPELLVLLKESQQEHFSNLVQNEVQSQMEPKRLGFGQVCRWAGGKRYRHEYCMSVELDTGKYNLWLLTDVTVIRVQGGGGCFSTTTPNIPLLERWSWFSQMPTNWSFFWHICKTFSRTKPKQLYQPS